MSCHKPGRVVARVSPSPGPAERSGGGGGQVQPWQVAPRPQLLNSGPQVDDAWGGQGREA